VVADVVVQVPPRGGVPYAIHVLCRRIAGRDVTDEDLTGGAGTIVAVIRVDQALTEPAHLVTGAVRVRETIRRHRAADVVDADQITETGIVIRAQTAFRLLRRTRTRLAGLARQAIRVHQALRWRAGLGACAIDADEPRLTIAVHDAIPAFGLCLAADACGTHETDLAVRVDQAWAAFRLRRFLARAVRTDQIGLTVGIIDTGTADILRRLVAETGVADEAAQAIGVIGAGTAFVVRRLVAETGVADEAAQAVRVVRAGAAFRLKRGAGSVHARVVRGAVPVLRTLGSAAVLRADGTRAHETGLAVTSVRAWVALSA